MMQKIGLIVLIILILGLLTGCVGQNKSFIKEGKVMRIEHDVAFGGTFSDWRDELHFDDGTVIWVKDRQQDLSSIRLNTTGKFYFEKDYFVYEGVKYKFTKFMGVLYYDNEMYDYVEV